MGWQDHDKFLNIIKNIDIIIQISNSETFNIVAADAVKMNVPVIGSSEIPWLPKEYCANPNDIDNICNRIIHVYNNLNCVSITSEQFLSLKYYILKTKLIWNRYFT